MNVFNISQLKELPSLDVKTIDLSMSDILGDVNLRTDVYLHLSSIVQSKPGAVMYQYKNTFLYWYSLVGWSHVRSLNHDQIIQLCNIAIVSGVVQGVVVWDAIISYLYASTKDPDDMIALYTQMRQNFFTSSQIVFEKKDGKLVSLSQYVKMYEDIQKKNNSLETAEFLSDVTERISVSFSDNLMRYSVTSGFVLDSTHDLIHFFRGVDSENIYYVVEAYLYPAKYAEEGQQVGGVSDKQEAVTLTSLQLEVMSVVTTTADAQFIIGVLDQLAVKYVEPRILDVYYFNEQTNQFEWDEALLKELKLIPPDFDMSTIAK